MENLRNLYTDYVAQAEKVRKEAPAFAGIFGLGSDPRKDPCHMAFYENVQKWMQEFIAATPTREQAMQTAIFLLEEPRKHLNKEGYWFLYVCVGFVKELIPFLEAPDCKALAERMNTLYPRRERMPLQQETLKLLQKAGK